MFRINDVVQIDPASDEKFGGCFMIITEVKTWGAKGYITVPGFTGLAYYNCNNKNMIFIGVAAWST